MEGKRGGESDRLTDEERKRRKGRKGKEVNGERE